MTEKNTSSLAPSAASATSAASLVSAAPTLLDAASARPAETAGAAAALDATLPAKPGADAARADALVQPLGAISSAAPSPSLLGTLLAEMQGAAAATAGADSADQVEAASSVADEADVAVPDDDSPFALPAPTAAARIVTYARDKRVAFAPHATQELIENPQCMPVPGGAYYAHGLLHWQNRHIPFIDLESLLLAYPAFDPQVPVPYALVLAYQTAPHEPLQYGAIAMTDIPSSQTVSDADFSPLPSDSDMWAELAISCFKQNGQVIPILDAAKIFSRYHG